MSTKAKIGKDWVKCQVVLQETGETLHLTFAPGQTRKKIHVHIDGRTDTGFIALEGLSAEPPHDATLKLSLDGAGVRVTKPVEVKEAKPVAPPKPAPAPVVAAPPPKPETGVAASEENAITAVQEPAADTNSVAGGKRGRKPASQVSE